MKTGGLISAATRKNRRLLSSTRGSMTIPGIVFFTILMAVSGLAIDIQRLYGVHGTMQAYVDNVALAAAAELDGQSDAITRSFRAARGDDVVPDPLVKGAAKSAPFATDTTLSVQRVTFLESISADPGPLAPTPTADDEVLCTFTGPAFAASCENGLTPGTASPTARFVEVVAAPRTVTYFVLPIADVIMDIVGAPHVTAQAQVRLRATAGFRRALCNNTPLMICNPTEAIEGPGADFEFVRGQQIFAKLQGPGAAWEPPNFGLLNTFSETTDEKLRQMLGMVSPGTTCSEDEVTVKTGQNTGQVRQGFNVRFDIYEGQMNKENSNAQYRPAPNVVRGMKPNNTGMNAACNPEKSIQSMPFPRDNCFMLSPTPGAGTGCTYYDEVARFGDGNWARNEYWATNHPGETPPAGYSTMSRYDVYRYEITHPVNIPGDENGNPACYDNATPPDVHPDRDRRLIYVAVVNCLEELADEDETSNVGHGPVPVKAYAKVFVTEPVGNTTWCNDAGGCERAGIRWPRVSNDDVMVEVVDLVEANDESGHLHVYPVLYR